MKPKNKFLVTGRFSTVIRVPMRERFLKEKNKGALVNDLLEKHYRKNK